MKRFFILIAILVCFQSTFAQEALSLSDAILLGLNRNFDIQIEEKNVEIAGNNNSWGEAGRYPTVSLNLNQNNSVTDNIKTATPFQLQDITISQGLSPAVNLDWTLFNGFKIVMSKRRLEQLQAETSGNASIVVANTIEAIILAYYNVLVQEKAMEEIEKQLELSRDKFEYIKIKSELGSAGSQDVFVEEGNYLTDSLTSMEQELTYRSAIRDLNILLAEQDADKQFRLTTDLNMEVPAYQLEDLEEKLFDNNVDLRKQYITQEILGYDLQMSKADRWPSLSLSAGASNSRSRVDLSNASFPSDNGFVPGPADPLNAVTNNYFANLSVSFTLFNGGRINRAIKNSIAREEIGEIRVEKLTTSLTNDLYDEFDRFQIRKQVYDINVRREQVAKSNLALSREKFRNGTINSFDFRIVQNNYLSAAITRLRATYSLISSHVALMRLTGGLIEEYNN